MPIIDCHCHAFPDHVAPSAMKSLIAETIWHPVVSFHDGTLAGLLAGMDRAGIERAVVCSVATRPAQVKKITEWSAAIASPRILPFASVHPDFDQPEAELERIASLGLKGIKFHPQYAECAIDDPRNIRIAKAAERLGLSLVIHPGYDVSFPKDDLGAPRRLRALHEAVPGLRILAAHGGGWERWEEALEHVAGQRIYLDTSFALGGLCPRRILEKILERHPPKFLVFGSDSPWIDQVAELKQFLALPISEEAKQAALWENGLHFVGL